MQFVIVMAVLGAVGYAGYLYVPVAYQAHMYKDLMQHYADVTSAQGYKPAWAGEQLLKNAPEYNIPANAVITPVLRDSRIEIRVQYVQPVEFPGYTYNYEFDYTAKSTAFLAFK